MSTIKITSIENVEVGDVVMMKRGDATVKAPVGKNDAVSGPNLFVIYLDGFGTLYGRDGWTLTYATREVPEWEPGTAGTAVLRDVPYPGGKSNRLHVMRTRPHQGSCAWVDEFGASLLDTNVTDFVPDDIEALRADLDAERAKVSDLTGRNAALEALAQEQKRGLRARDTWIEDQTADA